MKLASVHMPIAASFLSPEKSGTVQFAGATVIDELQATRDPATNDWYSTMLLLPILLRLKFPVKFAPVHSVLAAVRLLPMRFGTRHCPLASGASTTICAVLQVSTEFAGNVWDATMSVEFRPESSNVPVKPASVHAVRASAWVRPIRFGTRHCPVVSVAVGVTGVAEGVADVAVTEGVADVAVTEGVADVAVAEGVADVAVTEGVADVAVTEGVADVAVAEGVADVAVAEGVADVAVTEGVADVAVAVAGVVASVAVARVTVVATGTVADAMTGAVAVDTGTTVVAPGIAVGTVVPAPADGLVVGMITPPISAVDTVVAVAGTIVAGREVGRTVVGRAVANGSIVACERPLLISTKTSEVLVPIPPRTPTLIITTSPIKTAYSTTD